MLAAALLLAGCSGRSGGGSYQVDRPSGNDRPPPRETGRTSPFALDVDTASCACARHLAARPAGGR